MEGDLKCPVCGDVVTEPTVLPCSHQICGRCFQGILSHAVNTTVNDAVESEIRAPRRPKVSEPESGYSTASNDSSTSRMQFYGGVNDLSESGQRYELATSPNRVPRKEVSFTCPVCKRTIFVGEPPASGGRRRRQSSASSRPESLEIPHPAEVMNDFQRMDLQGVEVQYCEMCEVGATVIAKIKCEQCKVRYCEQCLQRYHPPRGPLASHFLSRVRHRRNSGRPKSRTISGSNPSTPTVKELQVGNFFNEYQTDDSMQQGVKLSTCAFHVMESMTLYCDECCAPLCPRCVEDGRHKGHNVKPIGSVYETYKTDLSRGMSGLSSKAKLVTNLIVQLRGMQNEIQNSYSNLEARAVAQCNSLVEAIEQKKREILQNVATEKERQSKVIREQLQYSTMKLKRTTGLLEYCIEIMKGNDAAVFLQVSPGLVQRVSATDQQWSDDDLVVKASGELDVDIDCRNVLKTIEEFNIVRRGAPERPMIKISECSAVNNTVTLSWAAPPLSRIDAYILELDDGSRGPFRDVYHGKQTACTIDGLHFDSVYRARVSAYNKAGRSSCSDIVQLQTSEVAIFRMDPNLSHPDIRLSQDCCTIGCKSTDQKIGIANTCFSKGVHYWEFSVDYYEPSSDPDVAIGVATSKVNTNFILGKDAYAWAMYVDSTRTWFLHKNVHTSRIESGVQVGSRLGVLLNFPNQTITYFVNQKQRGEPVSIAIDESSKQPGSVKSRLYYPAISLNNKVKLTLWSGLRPAFHGKATVPSDTNIAYKSNTLPGQKNDSTSFHTPFARPDAGDIASKKSQSSFDLKNQLGSGDRLYHSLPPKLVNKATLQPLPYVSNKRPAVLSDSRLPPGIDPSKFGKPPIPTKPSARPSGESSRSKDASRCVDDAPVIRVWRDDNVPSS